MLEPTAPRDSAAIAHAERRVWLLDLMLRLCAALLAVVRSDHGSAAWLQWARARASAAIARVTGLAQALKIETERRLYALRAYVAHEPLPVSRWSAAPIRAWRTERAQAPVPREPRVTVGVDAAFLARVEALEAFLDQEADGRNAQLRAREAASRLCGALGLDPDWSRWLEDDWLAANLDLNRLPAGPAPEPLCIPPPPHPSPPGPPSAEASFSELTARRWLRPGAGPPTPVARCPPRAW